MQVSKRLFRRRAYRRRDLRRGQRAVVSVVGTLLALLVFFAIFGIFITQYVPLWMGENESVFSSQIQASIAELKSNIDLQSTLGGPASLSAPFPLSSQGIPLIAEPTAATLLYVPRAQGVYLNVSMQFGPSGRPNFYLNESLGTINVQLPDRYYPAQSFEYEGDAVIQSQGDTQQVMLYPPTFTINTTGAHSSGSIGLVQLFGNASQQVSSGSVEVYSEFSNVQEYPTNGSTAAPGTPFAVNITLGTLYPCAWATFLNQTMHESGMPAASYTLSPSTCVPSLGQSTVIHLNLHSMSSFNLILANFNVVMGVGEN